MAWAATLGAMVPTATGRQGRRVLLVVAALLATLEVGGALVASAAVARASEGQRIWPTSAAAIAAAEPETRRVPSQWQRLAAELPLSEELSPWRTHPVRLADAVYDRREPAPAVATAATPAEAAQAEGPQAVVAASTPAPAGRKTAAAASSPAGASRAAVVVNRLRIPDLRIDRTTRSFSCDRAEPPGNYVYRWGCAGHNNLYLLGHAATVFKPLHDAYVAGRLRVGMVAWYTHPDGRAQRYRVQSWRVVEPTEVDWAIASQSVPSITLQTCYGAGNRYRLLVRLVAG